MAHYAIIYRLLLLIASHLWIYPQSATSCWKNQHIVESNPLNQTNQTSNSTNAFRFHIRERWIVDSYGRVRIFHGFNSVVKGPPFINTNLLNVTRAKLYRQWGFNAIRLGTMWAGAEPLRAGQYNNSYLGKLKDAVELLGSHGLYSILDMHQVSTYLTYLLRNN